jgi:hypothetical protein
MVRPRLQASTMAPTHPIGPSALALLCTVAAPPGRAPSMVGLARGCLKRFGNGDGLKGNNCSVLGSGEGSPVGVYIGENLRRMFRGLLQPSLP